MAAGLGTRLRPLTDVLPKPMVPIANRPVLHHLLNLLARHDVRDVGVNIHVFPELIERYFGDGSALGMRIRWSYEEPSCSAPPAARRSSRTSGNGRRSSSRPATASTTSTSPPCSATTSAPARSPRSRVKPVDDPSAYGVVILDRDTRIRGFQEKPSRDEARSDLANCGVYVDRAGAARPGAAGHVLRLRQRTSGRRSSQSGEPIYAYTTMAYWNDVGGLDELRNSILDAVSGRVRIDIPGEEIAPGVWAEAGCVVDPAATVEGPIVLGRNVVIEAGARIRGPAAIGADSRVGTDAAIRSAALLPGSVVPSEGIAIAGIFGDASKLAESILRYPATRVLTTRHVVTGSTRSRH